VLARAQHDEEISDEGKVHVVFDDSIIIGTTAKKRSAVFVGAGEVSAHHACHGKTARRDDGIQPTTVTERGSARPVKTQADRGEYGG